MVWQELRKEMGGIPPLTCDCEIANYIKSSGGRVVMTGSRHERASDLAEAKFIPMVKQVCIILFRRKFPLEYIRMAPTPLENSESVDMMRVLERGMKVRDGVDRPQIVFRGYAGRFSQGRETSASSE